MDDNYDKLLKCIFIGDAYVGKTSLCTKLIGNDFPLSYLSTIGVDFFVKILKINNEKIKVQMWDTTGQEQYKAITRTFYRNVGFVFLMFDLTNTKSFFNLKRWISDIYEYCDIEAKIVLIGNKSDLESNINFNLVNNFCDEYDLKFYKCSVKFDNIEELIMKILTENLQVNTINNMIIDDRVIKVNNKNKKSCCKII